MDKFITLRHVEAGQYIPAHDPSFVHGNLEDAVKEAHHDLKHGAPEMAVYQVVQVVSEVPSAET